MMTRLATTLARTRTDLLLPATERLECALAADVAGQERRWAESVDQVLTDVEKGLRQHVAAVKSPDGVLAEADRTRPTLARRKNDLFQEQTDLLAQTISLRREVQRASEAFNYATTPTVQGAAQAPPLTSTVTDFGTLRRQGEELLARLEHTQSAEASLVLESVNTDIGAGD